MIIVLTSCVDVNSSSNCSETAYGSRVFACILRPCSFILLPCFYSYMRHRKYILDTGNVNLSTVYSQSSEVGCVGFPSASQQTCIEKMPLRFLAVKFQIHHEHSLANSKPVCFCWMSPESENKTVVLSRHEKLVRIQQFLRIQK